MVQNRIRNTSQIPNPPTQNKSHPTNPFNQLFFYLKKNIRKPGNLFGFFLFNLKEYFSKFYYQRRAPPQGLDKILVLAIMECRL